MSGSACPAALHPAPPRHPARHPRLTRGTTPAFPHRPLPQGHQHDEQPTSPVAVSDPDPSVFVCPGSQVGPRATCQRKTHKYGHAYRAAWEAGHPAEQTDIAVAVHGFVADTDDQARATYLQYEHRMMAAIELLGTKVLPRIRAELGPRCTAGHQPPQARSASAGTR
ncbi:hypothetical protein OG440_00760 [Streptomyces sp. NBC_00637]|uniref:hypothetical protein n=1 Tax=Streptomyces sp. NBC_00637 TaxID=2903667 RepID=UPI00325391D7